MFGEAKQLRAWQEALSQVIWKGRMEEVQPDIFIDGAHNISAVERFAESVKKNSTGQGTILLFSAVQDKDYEQMIAYLCRQVDAEIYLVTQIQDKRAEARGILAETFRNINGQACIGDGNNRRCMGIYNEKPEWKKGVLAWVLYIW